jgi:hypothetical protein
MIARAQDAAPLLDLLVKKRLITDQEAEEGRGELTREAAGLHEGERHQSHTDRWQPALRGNRSTPKPIPMRARPSTT